jgi:hypothetical protein
LKQWKELDEDLEKATKKSEETRSKITKLQKECDTYEKRKIT